MRKAFLAACVALFVSMGASANEVTGTIRTMYVNLQVGKAYVQMDGLLQFDGGGCAVYWSANDITDANFMKYVWSLLLTAKASGSSVTIVTDGCNGVFPKIVAAELEPRAAN